MTQTYPNPDNYPYPSFTIPVQSPDVDPDAGDLLYVGLNPAWIPVLLGAMDQLLLPSTWEGNHDEVITALNRASMLKGLIGGADLLSAPAPYWDNPDDVDDQEPADVQPWYGKMEGLDFVEELGIWVITGFIAYSGQIGAAIAFKTFAPRFALAWKQGGVIAAVEVFIDGVSNGELEIGSGSGIVESNYIGDPDLDEHDIRVELVGVGESFSRGANVRHSEVPKRLRGRPTRHSRQPRHGSR